MSRIVLMPHGTTGDVLPLIWIGRQMRALGHSVLLVWLETYREAALQAGLEFAPLKNDGYEELVRNPAFWRPHQSLKLTYAYAGRCVPKYVEAVMEDISRNGRPDLMLAPIMNFAAPLLRAKLGTPLISTHLSTLQFVSAHAVPLSVPFARLLRLLPVPMRRFFLTNVAPYDHHAFPHVRQCCAEQGVKPPRRLRDWWHSPDGSLALFPEWVASAQPDWPPNTFQWDFPLEDLADARPLEPDLSTFLAAGDKPVVFTLGSHHLHSRRYFEMAAEITARLGCRAVFATRDALQVPTGLPSSIFVTTYAPFSALLPHAAAFVHHGGMGTLSQCFMAGIPQLVTPMAYDQPDNAAIVERLGAGLALNLDQFTVERALPLLRRCLEQESLRHQAGECARRMRHRPPATNLTSWLEARCAEGHLHSSFSS
jgi:rhamnosyltransferase subunit B